MLLSVEDDERVKVGKVLCWTVPKKRNRVLMLQIKDLRVD